MFVGAPDAHHSPERVGGFHHGSPCEQVGDLWNPGSVEQPAPPIAAEIGTKLQNNRGDAPRADVGEDNDLTKIGSLGDLSPIQGSVKPYVVGIADVDELGGPGTILIEQTGGEDEGSVAGGGPLRACDSRCREDHSDGKSGHHAIR